MFVCVILLVWTSSHSADVCMALSNVSQRGKLHYGRMPATVEWDSSFLPAVCFDSWKKALMYTSWSWRHQKYLFCIQGTTSIFIGNKQKEKPHRVAKKKNENQICKWKIWSSFSPTMGNVNKMRKLWSTLKKTYLEIPHSQKSSHFHPFVRKR